MADRVVSCQVITPDGVVYDGTVDMVIATTTRGEVGVLPLHTPLVTLLAHGELRLKTGDKVEYIAVHGGYLDVREDRVTVLAAAAEPIAELTAEAAQKMVDEADALLTAARESGEGVEEAEAELERAINRLAIATKRAK